MKFIIEYKNVHFKRVLIKELRGNVSIYELEKLKYCNVDLIKSTGDKIFDDYINFALCIIELKTHYTYLHEYLNEIDFENGYISNELSEKIDDPILNEWIMTCLNPHSEKHEIFFTD